MHDDGIFGEPVAARYDESSAEMFDASVVDPVVDLLVEFAGDVGVPDLRRLPPGDSARVFHVSEERWGIDEYDVATQELVSHHFETVEGGLERTSFPFRYVWPAELDRMAQLAGMRLRDRWGGWKREPFTNESDSHVSIWEKPAG